MISVIIPSEPASRLSTVASIAHDLCNPLAAIHGGAEMLVSSILSQAEVHRIARNMYSASVRMRELLEEFIDQSRTAEKELQLTDLHQLIARAVDKIAVTAGLQGVHIIIRIAPSGLKLGLDRHSIHRVLVNLLVNALEVMPQGGTIQISALSDRHSVLIRVRDSGPGISPEVRDRLFQPFATACKANGIGLGLASSRQTVLDHGGEMWAESSPEGACFAVRLPLTRKRAASQAESPHAMASLTGRALPHDSISSESELPRGK